MSHLRFEPIYLADRIRVINPFGDVGVVTLWSKVDQAITQFTAINAALTDPSASRIAAIANLYGDGMFAMFCNLLNNPQIRYLIAVGQPLNLPICDEIEAFINYGLEEGEVLGKTMRRIKGTDRYFPDVPEFDESTLRQNLAFRYFGKFSSPNLASELSEYFEKLPPPPEARPSRIRVTIPESRPTEFEYLPSNPLGHQVTRDSPLQSWEELIVRVMRFGRPIQLRKGQRLELQNVKVVIRSPEEDPPDALERYGFNIERFRSYQNDLLSPGLPENISYTYGNRLRGYFSQGPSDQDTLQTVIDRLAHDPESRHCYIALWDTASDLTRPQDDTTVPCLTTLFFRITEGKLGLTATYRSHNLLTAWLENVYGLMGIQRYVCEQLRMPGGPITILSHSLGIDPASTRFVYAEGLSDKWKTDDDFNHWRGKYYLREDPNGYFTVTADLERKVIVAEHRFGSVLVKRYQARRAADIEKEVASDMAISLVSHAMWLGRELARCEQNIRTGGGSDVGAARNDT